MPWSELWRTAKSWARLLKRSPLSAEVLLTQEELRRQQWLKNFRLANPSAQPKRRSPQTRRFFTVWEADRKYEWLDRANHDPNREIFHIHRGLLDTAFRYLLKEYRGALNDNWIEEYCSPRHQVARKRFREFCRDCLQDLHDVYGIDVLFVPKLHDDWIIDFNLAAQELGLKILCNERESVVTQQRLLYSAPLYAKHVGLVVDQLALGSENHRSYFVAAQYPLDKMKIIGDIKSDYWFHPELWPTRPEQIHPKLDSKKFRILFFAFGKDTYKYVTTEKRNWNDLTRDFHEALLEILKRHRDRVQIIYKTGSKPNRDAYQGYDAFAEQTERLGGDSVFLSLNNQYSAQDLMIHSDAVVGFQTTGLIEAMFTDVPIFTGGWGELYEDLKDTLLPFHQTKAIRHCQSKAELQEQLDSCVQRRERASSDVVSRARKEFREIYYFQPDGNASSRLLAEADHLTLKRIHSITSPIQERGLS